MLVLCFIVRTSFSLGLEYAAVIDAGSSGSRMHVFAWPQKHSCSQKMANREILEVGPGRKLQAGLDTISPKDVGAYLTPLLKYAESMVPAARQPTTKIYLHATAGMRLLPSAAQTKIMEAVTARLRRCRFLLARAEVVDGIEEGAHEWLAANYLLGKLHGKFGADGTLSTTVAVLGMGGASTQFVFKPDIGAPLPRLCAMLFCGSAVSEGSEILR